MTKRVLVIGAGIFGVTAAIELRTRGADVTLVDPGPLPHPLAESTDISKVIRADYGSDALYTQLMERSLERWRDWNGSIARGLFHECGVLFVTRRAMQPGGFEHDSFALLSSRGHRLTRLGGTALQSRFPEWNGARYADGYYNESGGWAESGNVVAALLAHARDRGVVLQEGVRVVGERFSSDRTTAVLTADGVTIEAELFVFAVGCFGRSLLADLAPSFRATGHPVMHLTPPSLERFDERRFPVFGADISQTGLYGFPVTRSGNRGVVKVASHGPGRVVDPWSQEERTITEEEVREVRDPLREALPALGDAPAAATRICVYGDTHDGDLWIAPDPERPNRVVATGGSGHAFKFAPVLGELIADACAGKVEPRFRWRPEIREAKPADAARHV